MLIDLAISEQSISNSDDPQGQRDVSLTIRQILADADVTLDEKGISRPESAHLVRRGSIELVRLAQNRLANDHSTDFIDLLFGPRAKNLVTFGELCAQYMELYLEENSGKPQQHNQVRSRVSVIRQLIGDDLAVRAIDF